MPLLSWILPMTRVLLAYRSTFTRSVEPICNCCPFTFLPHHPHARLQPCVARVVIRTARRKEVFRNRGIEQAADNQTHVVQTQHIHRSRDFHSSLGLEDEAVCRHVETDKRGLVHDL